MDLNAEIFGWLAELQAEITELKARVAKLESIRHSPRPTLVRETLDKPPATVSEIAAARRRG